MTAVNLLLTAGIVPDRWMQQSFIGIKPNKSAAPSRLWNKKRRDLSYGWKYKGNDKEKPAVKTLPPLNGV